jgi:hypothetical protein
MERNHVTGHKLQRAGGPMGDWRPLVRSLGRWERGDGSKNSRRLQVTSRSNVKLET